MAGLLGKDTFLKLGLEIVAQNQANTRTTGLYYVQGTSTTAAAYDSGLFLVLRNSDVCVQLKFCINTGNFLYRIGSSDTSQAMPGFNTIV